MEKIAKESYPHVELLRTGEGSRNADRADVCCLSAEKPASLPKSREVGCFLGLCPGRRTVRASRRCASLFKEGDRYLRTMCGTSCWSRRDLRRWGLKLAARGGKNAKKRAVVAVARKLAVLLHRLWVSGEVYEPLRNGRNAHRGLEGRTPHKQGC